MSPSNRIKFRKVLNITVWWVVINVLFALYNDALVHSNFVEEVSESYDIWLSLMANIVSAVLAGLFGASLLVFVVYERFRKRPYIQGVLAASGTFVILFYIITPIVAVLYFTNQTGASIFSEATKAAVLGQVFSVTSTTYMIVWALMISGTWLVIQISEKFGPGVLWKLIKGHYQLPKQEDRIFMFIDLKSSTSLAEGLGNERYFNLLQDFFSDITNPVINTQGEIYQYVGDEVVITWPLSRGIKNNNCLKCYQMIRQVIAGKSKKYLRKFGVVPEFRAGIHYGKVITGEIGILKKDISFSGDVLNTTSRITEECKKYETDLIVSEDLTNRLEIPTNIQITELGSMLLRGKSRPLSLISFKL